jgi:hypothetical protein
VALYKEVVPHVVFEMTPVNARRYFVEDPVVDSSGHPKYLAMEMHTLHPSQSLLKLTVAATFSEVWLAKEGHDGPIGMNLLTKIELPTLPSLYGALLAGVDYIIMGAGIPRYAKISCAVTCTSSRTVLLTPCGRLQGDPSGPGPACAAPDV